MHFDRASNVSARARTRTENRKLWKRVYILVHAYTRVYYLSLPTPQDNCSTSRRAHTEHIVLVCACVFV